MKTDLLSVDKPARYMGGEMGSTIKSNPAVRIALAFPDLYEVGMSHLGSRILYKLLNDLEEVSAERVYALWPDMAQAMAENGDPLATLESGTPLSKVDMIGFTLQYELACTNILTMLNQAGLPLYAADRNNGWPLVIGGGPGAFNPEPLAPFFDAFLLGDGEEAAAEIALLLLEWKKTGNGDKRLLLEQLSTVEGVYIPSFFNPCYKGDGTISGIVPLKERYSTVRRRFLADLEDASFPDNPIIPFLKTIHDRVAVEIARGCTRGCRFCQAGYIYRPLRERSPEQICRLIETSLVNSGYEEISLLSLSTGDYSCIAPLLQTLMKRHAKDRVAVSLPSLRVGSLTQELIDEIKKVRKTGFTLAPEAGTERMRRVINKGISEQDLLDGAFNIYGAGWRLIKLYFMMGLPTETMDDLHAIPDLARKVKNMAKKAGGGGEVNVAISTFVPKPHTPFQWQRQLGLQETRERQQMLKQELRRRKLNFKYQEAELSYLEGVIARGDRRLAPVIERAVQLGACFDGWREHFSLERWLTAFTDCGVDPEWYLRERQLDEILPWDHLDAGLDRQFLLKELQNALDEAATPDCRNDRCSLCGVCDFKLLKNRTVQECSRIEPGISPEPTVEPVSRRVRLRFSKSDNIRFLSHLELINLFTRGVQRGRVPILYSQGFHPHPRFSFATATSVGIVSTAEYMDMFVAGMSASGVMQSLNRVLPAGLQILEAEEVPLKAESLSTLIEATCYHITLPSCDSALLVRQVKQFMSESSFILHRDKKGKEQSFDLRQEVHQLSARDNRLELVIGRGKPVEVVAAVTGVAAPQFEGMLIEKVAVQFRG